MIYRILAIQAHPDDVEILSAGTLAHLAEQGHSITIITMTAGDCGSTEYGPEEIARIRRKEAETAAHQIGAEYICAEFLDLAIFNDDSSRRRVAGLLRRVQPDIVLTSSPVDYHCDHEATSVLVRDACFGAPAPNYRTPGDAAPMKAIPHLYYMDPIDGRDRDGVPVQPDFVVDVQDRIGIKREMLAAHESQRAWLRTHHNMDNYIETMEEWAKERGKLAGVPYGEGFRQYMCHPYPTTPLLQELLGAKVKHVGR